MYLTLEHIPPRRTPPITRIRRWLRQRKSRTTLRELDDRVLLDVGLMRVRVGVGGHETVGFHLA